MQRSRLALAAPIFLCLGLASPVARAAPVECAGWQAAHPEWIWCDDFEDDAAMDRDYFEVTRRNGRFGVVSGEAWGGTHSARVRYLEGVVDSGGVKRAFGRNPVAQQSHPDEDFEEIYWRIHLKMEPGWQGNPYKLARATSFSSSDWSQAMVAHVWENGSLGLKLDPVSGVQGSQVVTQGYNDFAHFTWLGGADGPTEIFSSSEVGRWLCIETHVKLNTPGQSDGVFELWIDDRLEARRDGLNWRGGYTGHGINAILLENYWNGGAPRDQARWLDNLVISRGRIGCFDPQTGGAPPSDVENLRRDDTN